MKSYRTILKLAQDEFIEKKSRFIATVSPVSTPEEAVEFIATIKSRYKDATHNCSAFVLEDGVMRFSDDGEPSGTAGKPILEVLLKEELVNIAVVVTRYFGGIKLGGGGLIRAYATSAKVGIEACQIAQMCLGKRVKIHTDYNTIGKILHYLETENLTQEASEYTDIITITLTIASENYENFQSAITEISAGKSTVELLEDIIYPQPE